MEQLTPTQEALAALDAIQVNIYDKTCANYKHCQTIRAVLWDADALSQPAVGAQPLPAQPVATVRFDSGEVHIVPAVRDAHSSPLRDGQKLCACPPAPSEPAQPVPAGEETITVQEAWELAGGNPGIRATRQELAEALRQLDAVCDEAATHPQPAQASTQVPVAHSDGQLREWLIQLGACGTVDAAIVKFRSILASPVTPGEPAGAQAGWAAEWMETAIDLAVKWADARSSDEPTSEVVAAFEAMRLHLLSALTTMAAIPEAKEKL